MVDEGVSNMSGDLRVTTAHLRGLAATQQQAAAEIGAATRATEGVGTAVRVSHGAIGSATAAAVAAAQHARVAAGAAMERISATLDGDLTAAAGRYDGADQWTGDLLGRQIPPR